ncbi:MAG: hypothetical protein ACR2QJ_07275 [Geminicoccaceae bacterium]
MRNSLVIAGVALVMVACSPVSKDAERELAQSVNCETAEGDIRILENEKAHVAKQVASGVIAIAPIGLVTGVVTGTQDEKLEVATGEYDQQIDDKIAEIKSTCNL